MGNFWIIILIIEAIVIVVLVGGLFVKNYIFRFFDGFHLKEKLLLVHKLVMLEEGFSYFSNAMGMVILINYSTFLVSFRY